MDKQKRYHGEIWFLGKESQKQFGILFFKEDDIFIETNLHSSEMVFKELQIVGVFTGLGYATFVDCLIQNQTSGIIESRVYKPKYLFVSDEHIILTENLLIKEFYVINEAIVKWINHAVWYNNQTNSLSKKEFTDQYEIQQDEFMIEIQQFISYRMKNRSKLVISNHGKVKFILKEAVSVLKAIEIYDQFQEVLQFLRGGSSKFSEFKFQCLGCNAWQEVYYNDKKLSKSTYNFIYTEYKDIKSELSKILIAAYTNDSFRFCLHRLMDNFISSGISHSKRFTNSISAFEAFCKIYSGINQNNLKKYIKNYEEIFKSIGKLTDEECSSFAGKVIRSRDYHVHSNLKNRGIYSDFELLYVSFLFDFVIGYLLAKNIGLSESTLDKFINQGNRVYVDMKRTNQILSANSLGTD